MSAGKQTLARASRAQTVALRASVPTSRRPCTARRTTNVPSGNQSHTRAIIALLCDCFRSRHAPSSTNSPPPSSQVTHPAPEGQCRLRFSRFRRALRGTNESEVTARPLASMSMRIPSGSRNRSPGIGQGIADIQPPLAGLDLAHPRVGTSSSPPQRAWSAHGTGAVRAASPQSPVLGGVDGFHTRQV